MKTQTYPNLLVVLTALLMLAWPRSGWAQYNFITNADNTITITGYTGPGGDVTITNMINGHSVTAIGTNAFYNQPTVTNVTIPDSVTRIDELAFGYCSGLASVTIGNSVTSIGDHAFYDCYGLTSVTIPNSVTTIADGAFHGCSGLTSVTIPDSVTSIGIYVFYDCSGLTNIDVAGTNPSYASAGGVLFNNTVTTLVEYPGGLAGSYAIPNSVTNIGDHAFDSCYSLTSVTIPNSVTSIGAGAFYGCSSLTSVTIPDSVTSIGQEAFSGCAGLANIDVAGTNPSYASAGGVLFNETRTTLIQYPGGLTGSYAISNSVTSVGDYAFYDCSGLTSVTIPGSVTSIGEQAFSDCVGLTSVTIPNSVTRISVQAFDYCIGLTSVTIPGSVTNIGAGPFADCSGLTQINVAGTNPSYASAGGVLFNSTLTTLIQYPAGLSGNYAISNSVTRIGDYAFYDCSGLTSVTIPNSVTSIGDQAFFLCGGLTSVTIPNSVTSIGEHAFFGCIGLTSVTIPDSVTSIGKWAFQGCPGLHQAYFQGNAPSVNGGPGSADSTVFDGDSGTVYYVPGTTGWMNQFGGWPTAVWSSPATDFSYITNNDAITITGYTGPGGIVIIPGTINNYSVTVIGTNAFSDQYALTDVTIPESVTRIDVGAFFACSGLTDVTIPSNVTTIGPGAFAACSGLTNIDVKAANPSYASVSGVLFNISLTTLLQYPAGLAGSYVIPNSVTSIGEGAFANCIALTDVTIGNSVIGIGVLAFADCSGLTSVTIPDSVTSIGDNAFFICSGLTSVTIPNSVTSIGQYAFASCTSLHQAYFQGNAPSVDGGAGSADSTVFNGESGTAYYVPGTAGWGAQFGGWPTTGWYQPRPQILGSGYGLGVGSQGFQFTISWATNAAVVVEASTNLQDWTPVSTNTLVSGTNLFWDSDWAHYPQRFYRVGVEQ